MKKFGKGVALAFFLILSGICHAQETGQTLSQGYPVITRLDNRDSGFMQLTREVQENTMRIKRMNRDDEESVRDITGHLTIYQYIPGENDDFFFINSRCSLSQSTLASLNRIGRPSMLETGKPILIPSMNGLFIPESPDSSLEQLMLTNMEQQDPHSVRLTIRDPAGGSGSVFLFVPGADFSSYERTFFLNSGFVFPLRNYVRQTSPYGPRRNPFSGTMENHMGIDIAAPAGTEVYTVASGTVIEAGFHRLYGNLIKIRHANNY